MRPSPSVPGRDSADREGDDMGKEHRTHTAATGALGRGTRQWGADDVRKGVPMPASDSLRYIDSDGHILEPPRALPDYAPAEFRDRIWHIETEGDGVEWLVYDRARMPANMLAAAGVAGMSDDDREREPRVHDADPRGTRCARGVRPRGTPGRAARRRDRARRAGRLTLPLQARGDPCDRRWHRLVDDRPFHPCLGEAPDRTGVARSPIGRANKGSLKDLRPDDLSATSELSSLSELSAPSGAGVHPVCVMPRR